MRHLILACVAMPILFSTTAYAVNPPEVEAALQLVKQTHVDECAKRKLKVGLLSAHREHDQSRLNELEPQLDALNKRLKPVEDKLNALKASMNKNPDHKSAFETAMLEITDCGE